jgi:hypothetical protein
MTAHSALADPDEFAGVHDLPAHARVVEVFYSISAWFWRDMICYHADAHSSPLYLPYDASISPAGPFITALDAYIDAGGTLN